MCTVPAQWGLLPHDSGVLTVHKACTVRAQWGDFTVQGTVLDCARLCRGFSEQWAAGVEIGLGITLGVVLEVAQSAPPLGGKSALFDQAVAGALQLGP